MRRERTRSGAATSAGSATRRDVLVGLATAIILADAGPALGRTANGTAALVGSAAGRSCPGAPDMSGENIARARASWAAIGASALATGRVERDAGALRALFAEDLADPAPRARMAARVREDFAAGRCLSVDGWLLALTEARLAALVALAGREDAGPAGRGVS